MQTAMKPTNKFPLKLMGAVIIMAAMLEVVSALAWSTKGNELTISQIASAVDQGEVKTITVEGDRLGITFNDGRQMEARQDGGQSTVDALTALNVSMDKIQAVNWDVKASSPLESLLRSFVLVSPIMILAAVFVLAVIYALRAFTRRVS